MRRRIPFILLFILGCVAGMAQGVVISSNPLDVPAASTMFEVRGTDGGLLVPSVTEAQRLALTATAAEGLWVFQSDNHKGHFVFKGSTWVRASNARTVAGKVITNPSTEALTGTGGSGFTATQPNFPSDKGEFNILFNTPFGATPSVMLTSNILAALPINTEPVLYCAPTHSFTCSVPLGADYIDDVIVQSCESLGGGTFNCITDLNDVNTGCNGTTDNYVDNFATMGTTLYGTNHGDGDSYFNMTMSSGPEWRDNLFGFIDWNQDADFDDPDEVVFEHYFSSGDDYSQSIVEPLISIPAIAKTGETVLRTMTLFVVSTPDPCADLTWGETQDYKVTIVDGSVELGDVRPSHCTTSNITASGFKVYCTTLTEQRVGTSFHFYATEN